MPATGSNSRRIASSRVAGGRRYSTAAAESVIDAPKPSTAWYDTSGSTTIVGCGEVPVRNGTGGCSASSAERSTVVSQTRAAGLCAGAPATGPAGARPSSARDTTVATARLMGTPLVHRHPPLAAGGSQRSRRVEGQRGVESLVGGADDVRDHTD